ncbi:MAG TPA: 6-phosphogluconolactonase [Verrucomicrobiae bacterium]
MPNLELISFSSDAELARAAANAWLDEIEAANRAGEKHCVALSGGRITQKFFAATVELARARKISFAATHFFWADERCVPPTDPESNFKLADELLFKPLNINAKNVHRLRGEDPAPAAAQFAEAELRRFAPLNPERMPMLDLIFLGMGEDGHVASLFPDQFEKNADMPVPFLVVENSPKPPPVRISLSFKAIIAAKKIWVLASGAGKAPAMHEAMLTTGRTNSLGRIIRARAVKIFSDIKGF